MRLPIHPLLFRALFACGCQGRQKRRDGQVMTLCKVMERLTSGLMSTAFQIGARQVRTAVEKCGSESKSVVGTLLDLPEFPYPIKNSSSLKNTGNHVSTFPLSMSTIILYELTKSVRSPWYVCDSPFIRNQYTRALLHFTELDSLYVPVLLHVVSIFLSYYKCGKA